MNLGRTRGVVEIMDVGDFDTVVNVLPSTVEAVSEERIAVEATETVNA